MKKIWLVGLALATILAAAPAAMADTLYFSALGANTGDPNGTATTPSYVKASGALTVVSIGGGEYGVTSVSGVSITLNGVTSGATLVPNTTPWLPNTPNPDFYITDVVNKTGAEGYIPYISGDSGLVFKITSGTYDNYFVSIYYDGYGDVLSASDDPTGNIYIPTTNGYDVNFDVFTPEPSSLLLLGTGLLCMAGFLFWKARPSVVQAR